MISPWKLGWLNPRTSSCTGPMAMMVSFHLLVVGAILTADRKTGITR
jgi:hypothetical protein